MSKFVVTTIDNGQHRFNLEANNGKVISPSESYHNLKDMEKTMRNLSKHADKAWKKYKKEKDLKIKAAKKLIKQQKAAENKARKAAKQK